MYKQNYHNRRFFPAFSLFLHEAHIALCKLINDNIFIFAILDTDDL